MTNNASRVNLDNDLEDDVLVKKKVAPELDYMDWNYSVKFFHFLRDPPRPAVVPRPRHRQQRTLTPSVKYPTLERAQKLWNILCTVNVVEVGVVRGVEDVDEEPRLEL